MRKMRGKNGFFVIKVDLAKAYDRIRWSFIADCLTDIGLPANLIDIIMHSITSVKTNVMWNGSRSEIFKPQRGIRQGDPISPYLFVLCMDRLTHLIEEAVDNRQWHPIKAGRNGPEISHLMFADDLLLFGKATETNMACVMNTLDTFCSMSGQMVSIEKTTMFFSKNVNHSIRSTLARISGFKVTESMGRYLGVPLLGKSPRQNDFNYLVDKVKDRLSGWKSNHLSFAGRVTLSKSVIQAIPIYTMMTMPIPKSCLNEIQKLQRNFIWGDTQDKKRLHLIKWDTLTLPKECGGLGIKDLSVMNKSCMIKLAWNLRHDNTSLWSKVLKGKYGRGGDFSADLKMKVSDSFIWKAICDCSDVVKDMEAWSVGDGVSVRLWSDRWLDGVTRLQDKVVSVPLHMRDWKVNVLVDDAGAWKIDLVRGVLPDSVIRQLLDYPVPLAGDGPDIPYWTGDSSGKFSVANAYKLLSNIPITLADDFWKSVWRIEAPERVRYFAWQLAHGKLATKEYCGRWTDGDLTCFNCQQYTESILHVMRDCNLAMQLWLYLVPDDLKANFFGMDTLDWVQFNLLVEVKIDDIEWKNYWAVACHYLWTWRNRHIHEGDFVRPIHTHSIIRQVVKHYQQGTGILNSVISVSRKMVNVVWHHPPHGWVSVNTDGAVKLGSGVSACGGVIRNAEGRWLNGFAKRLFVPNAYLAELWGALEGIQLAHSMGFTNIVLQMDSSVIVDNLSNEKAGSMLGRSILNRIKRHLSLFSDVRVVHIFREANRVADGLANLGCALDEGLSVFPHPPLDIKQLVDADVLGVFTPRMISV